MELDYAALPWMSLGNPLSLHLIDFPLDVLNLIFALLEQRDLWALTHVSKRLRRIVLHDRYWAGAPETIFCLARKFWSSAREQTSGNDANDAAYSSMLYVLESISQKPQNFALNRNYDSCTVAMAMARFAANTCKQEQIRKLGSQCLGVCMAQSKDPVRVQSLIRTLLSNDSSQQVKLDTLRVLQQMIDQLRLLYCTPLESIIIGAVEAVYACADAQPGADTDLHTSLQAQIAAWELQTQYGDLVGSARLKKLLNRRRPARPVEELRRERKAATADQQAALRQRARPPRQADSLFSRFRSIFG